jgi:pyruvate/2-oxoglutarate dehydrogenase complex dihydrolipoamide acyltransferase (E2) component
MATTVFMEALSPTMEEGRLVKWEKHEGDTVKSGDTLAEVETDKAIMDLVARADGILGQISVKDGETVPVGKAIAIIAAAGEAVEGRGKREREELLPRLLPLRPSIGANTRRTGRTGSSTCDASPVPSSGSRSSRCNQCESFATRPTDRPRDRCRSKGCRRLGTRWASGEEGS